MKKMWNNSRVVLVSLLVLGALIIMLSLMGIIIQGSMLKLSAYFAGIIVVAVFLVLCAVLSVLITPDMRQKKVLPKVLNALLSSLRKDPNANVRFEAVKGLSEMNVERSSLHEEHGELDNVLISTLQHDPDPRVRSEAAEGLRELELEASSYDHKHHTLDDMIFPPKV